MYIDTLVSLWPRKQDMTKDDVFKKKKKKQNKDIATNNERLTRTYSWAVFF